MKTKLLITALSFTGFANAQGGWTQKANFGGTARTGAVGFSIGTKGYIGTGDANAYKQDFWEWDQTTNVWTQKADCGGGIRSYAIGFSIGTKGYIGTGHDGNAGKQDFWEWDQATNIWTQKANFGGGLRWSAVGFSIGTKGYIGTGNNFASRQQDFWEWDQTTNIWTKKADCGGGVRSSAIGFSIGTKGYIGTGVDINGSSTQDFWEWNQTSNSWTQKANFGGGLRWGAVGFSIGTKGYIGTGNSSDFWEYDPTGNAWIQKANFGGASRKDAVGFSIGTKGYIGTGFDSYYTFDFWEFNPCGVSYPPICLVTVDSLSKYNIVVWEKNNYPTADSFIVFREYITNNYLPIGAVSVDSLSIFIDTVRTQYFPITGDPNVSSYRYKLQVRDTCGNYSPLSLYHNTVHMVNNSGNFSWNFYDIENNPNPVTFYVLKRDNLNNGNWITVAGVSGTQNSITDPQYTTYQATANWRIETQWNISCTPSIKNPIPFATTINTTKSNTFKTSGNGINEFLSETSVTIYPNPTSGEFQIQADNKQFATDKEYKIEIYNVYGEKVYSEKISNHKSVIINLEQPNGIYFLSIKTQQGTANKKLIINK